MTTLLVLQTLAIALLGVLVAGLLRSHAEILRRLHELGAGYGDEVAPGPRAAPSAAGPIVGISPGGAAVAVAVGRPGQRTLLLFLSSGCGPCGHYWDALRDNAHERLTGTRTVVVARDSDEESPGRLAKLAPPNVTVLQSSATWDRYRVPGSPYAVVIGPDGRVAGEGTAGGWDQLISLVHQADGDQADGDRADRELAAAGILPGDPSLYPR